MPTMDIQVLEGVFDADEKARIIRGVTRAFGEVAGETMRDGLSVRIHEVRSGAWGYAGEVLHTEDALEMRRRG